MNDEPGGLRYPLRELIIPPANLPAHLRYIRIGERKVAGEEHEELERCRRREERRHHDGEQAVALIQLQAAFDAFAAESFPQKDLAAPAGESVPRTSLLSWTVSISSREISTAAR